MRQSRKKLRARALRANDSFASPTLVECSHHLEDGRTRGMLLWLAGYEAARRDARKPLKVSDIVTVTMGPLTSEGKALDINGALLDFTKPCPPLRDDSEFFTIPALNSEPKPRAIVPGDYVRLLAVRPIFQVSLRVGDIGLVQPNHGGSLLKVRWFTGDMWIAHEDVELVS